MKNMIDLNVDNTITLIHFELQTPVVHPGEELAFTFTLQNISDSPVPVHIRYELAVSDGMGGWKQRSYKLSSRKCPVGFLLYNHSHAIPEDYEYGRRSAMLPGTLRILINGQPFQSADFQVFIG